MEMTLAEVLKHNENAGNGRMYIAGRYTYDNEGIILARWNEREYVTWNFYIGADGAIDVSCGHYFRSLESAMQDYLER